MHAEVFNLSSIARRSVFWNDFSPRPGFTLIELLTVISVLGILASLTLPVVLRSKDLAARTIDVGNLKQLTSATHIYASDNADTMPWPNWLRGDGPGSRGWLYTFNESASGPNRFNVETGVLWPILKTRKLYWCPRDKPAHPMFKWRDQQSSSYVMNGAVCGYKRTLNPPLKLGSFVPEAVCYWETDENDPTFFNDGASNPDEGVSTRHNSGAICATFSGSVSHVKFAAWNRDAAATNKNRLWCCPISSDGR